MNIIKTWQERCSTDPTFPSSDKAMQAEIAELRAALAARATPAQPVEQKYTYASTQATKCACCLEHKHTPLRIDEMGGYVCLTCIDKRLSGLLGEFGYAPSPSSVGDAIRAMPLPDTELTTKIGMFEVRAWTKSHIGDILHAAAEIAEKAMPQKSSVEKMLEINQLDELGHEVARLQRALCFWLPSVVDCDGEVAERIFQDAFLLDGIDGNIPDDFKTAQELGWITLSEAAALAEQAQGQQAPEGWKLVPIEPTPEMCRAARTVPEPVKPYPPHFHLIWDAMLAAAPSIAQDGQKSEADHD